MRLLILLCLILIFFQGTSQIENCTSFRKGKYFYTPPNGGEVTFRRTNKKQIERYNNEHQRFIFKIIWLNECEYSLTLHNTKGVNRKIKKQIIGTILKCEIIRAELDHYIMYIDGDNESEPDKVTVYVK